MNIFFLPFAGGSRYSYRPFEERMPWPVRMIPLEYPGRGSRPGEALVYDTDRLVDDLYKQVRPVIAGDPYYAVYGHSMGGLMAFLLTRKLVDAGYCPPVHLFVSGTAGPAAIPGRREKRHLLNDADFIAELRRLNGCPPSILQSEEMLCYFLPILRADFTATETYLHRVEARLDLPVTVITGDEEDLTPDEIGAWRLESRRRVGFHRLPGDHFFILENPEAVLDIFTKELNLSVKSF